MAAYRASPLSSTPQADGFYMPAEWHPHKQCWMLWPTRKDNWYNHAVPGQRAFAAVANAIAEFEPVTVGVTADQYENARSLLNDGVRVVELTCDDSWMRDTAPLFVINGKGDVRAVDWEFNAYGGLVCGAYSSWEQDRLIARKVAEIEGVSRYYNKMVLEGGSIHVDGEGTAIVTEETLLNAGRNPDMTKEQIEEQLKLFLGLEKVIWIPFGVAGDEDTNGHVDNLLTYVRPGVVALLWTDDERDEQHARSVAAERVLLSTSDAKGRALEVHRIHQSTPTFYREQDLLHLEKQDEAYTRTVGQRMAGSYLNLYIANGGVIVPGLGDEKYDPLAVESVQRLFPNSKVVQVSSREILLGGGNIHCITMQQPLP